MIVRADALSARETEVLDALRDNLTNAEVAQRMHISVRTVESHVSSLLRKLQATDRRELAAKAAEMASNASVVRRDITGLPTSWTTFVGRTGELEEVILAIDTNRLVTILGPGGIGKTRLATVAAERVSAAFGGGGAFVDLVPVSSEFVVPAVAAALGLSERLQTSLESVVHDRLREGRALLVLDNCEHVLEAVVTFVQGVLASSPDVVVLATTREPLGLPGERLVAVRPLGTEAADLFLDRASAAGSELDVDPTLVAEICRRLDGMPLAIELAAARSGSLGVDGLLAGLDDHLRLLRRSSGPGGRHRSLRAVIDWSHELLDDEERTLFRRLAVFAGAFDLSLTMAVAADGDIAAASDVIGRLADKSLLVHRRDTAGSRWRMLDTVHAYAREQLEACGEYEVIRARHLVWAAATAVELESELDGEGSWIAQFDAVSDDLRSALDASGDGPDAAAFDLAFALGHVSYARGFFVEARGHYAAASSHAPDPLRVAAAERRAAEVAFAEMRGDVAFWHLMHAASASESAGDARARAIALADAASVAGRAPGTFETPLAHEAIVALATRAAEPAIPADLEVATHVTLGAAWSGRPQLTEPDPALASEALALARRLGDPVLISHALDAVAAAAQFAGHFKEASRRSSERLGFLGELDRHDPRSGGEIADIFHMGTEAAIAAGLLPAARACAQRAHDDPLFKGLPHLTSSRLLIPLALQGAFDDALVHAEATRASWERAGRPTVGWMAPALYATALVYGLRGDHSSYDRWRDLADHVRIEGSDADGFGSFVEQRIALHLGDLDRALAAAPERTTTRLGRHDAFAHGISAEIAVVAGALDAEQRIAELSSLAAENDFAAAGLIRATGLLHDDEAMLVEAIGRWEAIGARFERACTLMLVPSRRAEGQRELEALGCAVPSPLVP